MDKKTTTKTPKDLKHCDPSSIKREEFGSLTVWTGHYDYKPFPEAEAERTKYRLLVEGEKVWLKIYTGTLYGSLEHQGSLSANHDDAEEGWARWDSIAQFDRTIKEARNLKAGLILSEYRKGKKRGEGKFVTLTKS